MLYLSFCSSVDLFSNVCSQYKYSVFLSVIYGFHLFFLLFFSSIHVNMPKLCKSIKQLCYYLRNTKNRNASSQ